MYVHVHGGEDIGLLVAMAPSRCIITVPQLALEAQPGQATSDIQLALNPPPPRGAGVEQSCHKPSVRTNHICHITTPAGSVSLPSSLHSFPLLPPSTTSQTTSTTAADPVDLHHIGSDAWDIVLQRPSCNDSTMKDQPFTFASSFPPVPAKLVKRIQVLEFVEMRELLPDNMALSARLLGPPSPARQESYLQREIAGILPWTCTFTTYVAVVAQANPERVRHAGLHEAGGGSSPEVQGGKGLANIRHGVPAEQPGSRSQVGRTGPIALCSLRGRPGRACSGHMSVLHRG